MGKTIAEKIYNAHCIDMMDEETGVLKLDRIFCHELTTPMAIADLAARGKDRVFDCSRIKAVIDHVSPAKDSNTAEQGKILRDWAKRHGIKDFFDIGHNGICHVLFSEKGFVRPGFTVTMGDSHTCTYGAFGALAFGVGTTDLEVGLLKGVTTLRKPKTIRIKLHGGLRSGVFAKDLALAVIQKLTVNGATGKILEFTGQNIADLDMESRMTLCNMAVESGASCGICLPDMETVRYLWPFIKDDYASMEEALQDYARWSSDPDAEYEQTLSFDLGSLEPLVTFGCKPDQVKSVREMEGTPIDQVYIGSCTNGRISDLRAVAAVLKGKTVAPHVRAIVSPATTDVYAQAMEEGLLSVFLSAGFCITSPSCGACLGMSSGVLADGEVCVSTTNRNFAGRMGKGGIVHLASPATAAASAVAGHLVNSPLFLA